MFRGMSCFAGEHWIKGVDVLGLFIGRLVSWMGLDFLFVRPLWFASGVGLVNIWICVTWIDETFPSTAS